MTARHLDRRQLLAAAGALAGAGHGLTALGCSAGAEAPSLSPGQVTVPLSALPEGRRLVVMVGENPVEVVRTGGAVAARVLRCTHMGCVVRWKPEERIYACPCHDGRYDAEGRVLTGPPPLPLRTVPASIRGNRAILG